MSVQSALFIIVLYIIYIEDNNIYIILFKNNMTASCEDSVSCPRWHSADTSDSEERKIVRVHLRRHSGKALGQIGNHIHT